MPLEDWNPESLPFVFAICALTIGFCAYWFIAKSKLVRAWMVKKYGEEGMLANIIFYQKACGFVFLALIPAIAAWIVLGKSPADYGFRYEPSTIDDSLLWILVLVSIIWVLNFFNSRRKESIKMYPQIRKKVWTRKIFWFNALGWMVYLFSYEFLFRGILLQDTIAELGFWGAIVLNISLYMVSHIPKGLTETVGSIPMGLILCYVTIQTQTLWAGCITHFFLSWSVEVFCFYRNPEMSWAHKKA